VIFEESRSIRSFVGRIDEGDDVIEALTLLCDANDVTAAEVRVTGTLADVEVVRHDPSSGDYVPLVDDEGPFQVVRFNGTMARLGDQAVLRAEAMLAVDAPAGQQFVFGQLRRANAIDCEFVVQTYPDLAVTRKLDPATGRFPLQSIERDESAVPTAPTPTPEAAAPQRERKAPETVSEPAGTSRTETGETKEPPKAGEEESSLSWEDAMEASEDIKPASKRERRAPPPKDEGPKDAADVYGDYDFDEPILSAGDLLDHPKLGECRVIKVEEDEYAHIRLSRGQIRKLALEVVDLEYTGDRDGKNVFKVRVRK
jgi:predicted DNA-binding protein with PD1-like motif